MIFPIYLFSIILFNFFLLFQYDIAKIAALLHRAADMTHLPSMKETKFLLPKPALAVRDVKPSQWVNMVQSNWQECEGMTTIQAKAQVLGKLLEIDRNVITLKL